MAHYRVSKANGFDIALEDAAGRHHVAQALHDQLAVGEEFHGPRPACGFALLADTATKRLCRVIFKAVNGDTHEALPGWASRRSEWR